jgi:integrase
MNTVQIQTEERCNFIEISRNIKIPKRKNGFTSDGRPVPKEADSIKTKEEVNLIRNYFLDRKQYRNYMMWMLGICTAYRCGDILSLKFKDIFEDDKSTYKNNISIYEQKTSKLREMEITQPIQQAINMYLESINYKFELTDYLFASRKGDKSINVRSAEKILSNMAEEIGLNKKYNVSTHTMRKTYSYWFIMTHKNDITALSTLMELLNHSSERITLAYAGIAKEDRKAMSRDVSDLWG